MQDADLVVVEFTFNELQNAEMTHPGRRGFEQLLRKLLRLPGRPAVVVLHHWAAYFTGGNERSGGVFYTAGEQQLGVMAQASLSERASVQGCLGRSGPLGRFEFLQVICRSHFARPSPTQSFDFNEGTAWCAPQYYDMPTLSVRNAVYSLLQADVAPFKAGRTAAFQRVPLVPSHWCCTVLCLCPLRSLSLLPTAAGQRRDCARHEIQQGGPHSSGAARQRG